jgi:hypothetical protein
MRLAPSRLRPLALAWLAALGAVALLAGCGSSGQTTEIRQTGASNANIGGVTSTESNRPPGTRGDFAEGSPTRGNVGVRINRFAWRAALESVSFMPIVTADGQTGALVTDWYVPQSNPKERMKVTILVGGPELRGDTVKAQVFRQEQDRRGGWSNAKVHPQQARDLENIILQRARFLRQAQGG